MFENLNPLGKSTAVLEILIMLIIAYILGLITYWLYCRIKCKKKEEEIANLQLKISKVNNELADTNTKLEKCCSDKSELEERVNKVDIELADAKKKLEKCSSDKSELEHKFESTNAELKNTNNKLQQSISEKSEIENKFEKTNSELADSNNKLKKLISEKLELENKLKRTSIELESTNSKLQKCISEKTNIEASMAKISGELKNANNQVQLGISDKSELEAEYKKQLSLAKQNIDEINAKRDKLDRDINEMGQQHSDESERLLKDAKRLELAQRTLQEKWEQAMADKEKTQSENATLKADNDYLRLELSKLQDKNTELSGRILKFKSKEEAAKQLGFKPAKEEDKEDLTIISGIGKFIEEKLNHLGIYTIEQISDFTLETIYKVTEAIEFFPGRIQRDSWVEQANQIMKDRADKENK